MANVIAASQLTGADVEQVIELVHRVTAADGVKPLSEHVILRVRHGSSSPGRHVLLRAGGGLVGYAYIDLADADAAVAELAVGDRDAAGQLVAAVAAEAGSAVKIWARGDASTVAGVLASQGYRASRVLLQLCRSLADDLPEPQWPAGVTVRAFVPGQDESAWLALNNSAFADHPDQSGWALADVTEREQEPWFDPAGFFLAERAGELVGFHWTKVHAAGTGRGSEAVGEVYVVGVSPVMQGQRLGSALTLAGLRHLQAVGLSTVMLYVDEANHSAVHVYERLGFTRWDADTCYVSPITRAAAG
jgi:mycothiol synthase